MVTFDTTVTVAALVGAVSGLIALSNTLIQWQRGRSRARVDIWMGRGLRPDEPAVCFRIHNWGGRPLAPRAFVAITGTVFRRHRQPLVGVGATPPLAPQATTSDYFADPDLSCLDDVRSLALVDASGRRYRVRRRQLRQVQQRCREIRANPHFADGVMRLEPTASA